MINSVFIFNQKGDVLISRLIKDNVSRSVADVFRIHVISNLEVRSPVLTLGSTTFSHTRFNDMWLVAVTRSNSDASLIFEYLHKLVGILKAYLGEAATEDVLKEQANTVYAILEETLEFGYPQNTELSVLTQLVAPGPTYSAKSNSTGAIPEVSRPSRNRNNSSSIVPWRAAGISYRKDEVFVDIYEDINILVSREGAILKSFVDGKIMLNSHLSGMPLCRFGMNDASVAKSKDMMAEYDVKNSKAIPSQAAGQVHLEDCKFHPCVDLDKFYIDRVIEFTPPDGEFELMRYRTGEVNLPFKVTTQQYSSRGISLSLKSLFDEKLVAHDVVLKMPVPRSVIQASISASGGKAKFIAEERCIVWKFAKFSGLTEFSFSANLSNTNTNATESNPPMELQFELEMFSSSGMVVRYFKLAQGNAVKWVKYISRAGSYEIRY